MLRTGKERLNKAQEVWQPDEVRCFDGIVRLSVQMSGQAYCFLDYSSQRRKHHVPTAPRSHTTLTLAKMPSPPHFQEPYNRIKKELLKACKGMAPTLHLAATHFSHLCTPLSHFQEPYNRIKKELLKECKGMAPGERVLVVGNSREPFLCTKKDEKALMSFWSKHVFLPPPDFASRRVSRHGEASGLGVQAVGAGVWGGLRVRGNDGALEQAHVPAPA